MLGDNLREFCRRVPSSASVFNDYLALTTLSASRSAEFLQKLCQYLLNPEFTKDVAECFPKDVLLLLSTSISTTSIASSHSHSSIQVHRLNCVILGKLISLNPDVLSFTMTYFDKNPAPFTRNVSLAPEKKSRSNRASLQPVEVSDYDLVQATFNLLTAAPSHFKYKWQWSSFYHYLSHEDEKLQWVALKTVGILLNMSESTLSACAKVLLPSIKSPPLAGDPNAQKILLTTAEDLAILSDDENSKSFVSIAGVLLPVFGNTPAAQSSLIPVPSMQANLRSLALAVASRKCVCLQGPVGCGKTALVEHLARLTGRSSEDFIKVQLGDQTDSKMLLGTYRCTDIPGEFVWQPGVLTQAVSSGKWLLLEDIDSAALDVASVLSNLMETGTLSVPGYRDTLHADSGFQLFVTQRLISSVSGMHRQTIGATNLLEKHWLCVHMDPLTREELVIVVQTLFPKLATIAKKMIDVFLLFSMGSHDNSQSAEDRLMISTGRLISTRDLIKWCSRAIVDFEISSPDSALKVFQDAIDIFCCSVPDQLRRLELATAIGNTLGLVKTKAEHFVNVHKPSVETKPDVFIAGRAKVPRKLEQAVQVAQQKVKFSFTRPSAALLERVSNCVSQREPVLLVGETGTGKTSSIQFLARSTGHKLVVINMNQQSESADLLGGYKPVDMRFLIKPIKEDFEILFRSFYAIEPNRPFLNNLSKCYRDGNWKTLVTLMRSSSTAALKRLRGPEKTGDKRKSENGSQKSERKKQELLRNWDKLDKKLEKLKSQVSTHFSLAFAFIEGSLIKALQQGYWVLLDEINLASSETLECLSGLLEGSSGSLSLLERGDREAIKRHDDFTIFACMNPATDVGKKELPVGLRNRFTEFYVDELTEATDLHHLVHSYLEELNLPSEKEGAIVKFYLKVRKEAINSLSDGTGHKPHFSLRTLCRALSIAASNPCGNGVRSLYEAFCLSFLTQLDHKSYPVVERMIATVILHVKTMKSVLQTPIPKPKCSKDDDYINFEGYWVIKGTLEPEIPENYILTKSVQRNLKDLVRVVSIGKMPVLLQGDTSVGKTSLITYLAKASGHVCVRINNHEHTDLQEYVGSYVADETGKLVFKEGVLVEAMRKGHWIILDELNLAPSDVLEALNRVLDDNRELFIPETQEVVRAHSNFMLFATQNPPGLYGGRKVLSRAFRNRFVELHFDEIPADELQIILHKRCHMPESSCKRIISVMTELQVRRKSTAAFLGKQGFITLRDLFRWGERYRLAPDVKGELYDWNQHLADEGFLVLAAKVRRPEEAEEIREVIKKHLRRDVDPANLFSLSDKTSSVTRPILEAILDKPIPGFEHVVWTYHMRRMAVLVIKSCEFKEPVLLVGETGGGKTTVCQLAAAMRKRELFSVNCHMHTESADFLGSLRPVREHAEQQKKLFEWVDGPLITAMQQGDVFLADEISLADDSVLERMNSLLEPERRLLLAEKNTDAIDSAESDCVITAHENFCFIGTMNPGGDYGKKELSPALRNRFTEIWCEGCMSDGDIRKIIVHNLKSGSASEDKAISAGILSFLNALRTSEVGKKFTVSIRDVLTWVNFINTCRTESLSRLTPATAFVEGASLTYLDSLGSGATGSESKDKLEVFKKYLLQSIQSAVDELEKYGDSPMDESNSDKNDKFGIKPFYIPLGPKGQSTASDFTFTAPTTRSNTLKILRALQLTKPLLLEGSPGVGKTSLVSAVAKASGHNILRINLSDQTDVSDLFGADLPVEGGKGGQFAWKDGPFLRALRAGDWVLLDELNLASQSVLEGLNACLDHRGEIYIPELGRKFTVQPGTKLFACQNPLNQGGARRGLPKSFLNRFTQVYVDALSDDDLRIILEAQFPHLTRGIVENLVKFNSMVASLAGQSFAHYGAPWEMNLRDITRCCELISKLKDSSLSGQIAVINLIYASRMRTAADRAFMRNLIASVYGKCDERQPLVHVDDLHVYFDDVALPRTQNCFSTRQNLLLLRDQYPVLKSLAQSVNMNWMPILVGASGTGKSSVVRVLAQLAGQRLSSIVVNSAMDTTEILGGFEQTDYNRHLEELIEKTESYLISSLRTQLVDKNLKKVAELHEKLEKIRCLSTESSSTMAAETEVFLQRTKLLYDLLASMKTLETGQIEELTGVEMRLKTLADLVAQDNCLNAGGKFEWVDSVLVKCLRDGTWLLVDQVNLCSPAVLDRLNGLLEPGGVLTIGERGVDSDGNIHTIKPHKNFRLFLTMDPRYGEISRAMRNRGVEIFLLGHKDFCGNNKLDMKSMLYHGGLTCRNHQEALLNIHREISNQELSADKPSMIQLLQSAFLITQQISRGFAVKEAFTAACVDVYIKSKYVNDPNVKERVLSIIQNIISQSSITSSFTGCIDLRAITLNIADLQDNAQLAIIRQHGAILKALLSSETTEFLNEYLDPEGEYPNLRLTEIFNYLMLMYFEKSTLDDIEKRGLWLEQRIIESEMDGKRRDDLKASIERMKNEILRCKAVETPSCPWYTELSDAKKTALAVKLYFQSANLGAMIKHFDHKGKKTFTIEEYSYAVFNFNMTPIQTNSEVLILTNFYPFLEKVNNWYLVFLEKMHEDESYQNLHPADYVALRRDLQWLRRFREQGKEIISLKKISLASETANKDEKTIMTLIVHYRWLYKSLKKTLQLSTLNSECREILVGLETFLTEVNNSLRSKNNFHKLAKKLKKHLVIPQPFTSESVINAYKCLSDYTKQLSLSPKSRRCWYSNLLFLQFDEATKLRMDMIELWKSIFNDEFTQELSDDTLIAAMTFLRKITGKGNQEEPAVLRRMFDNEREVFQKLCSDCQLWPIYEFTFGLFAQKILRQVVQIAYSDCTERIDAQEATELLAKFAKIPCIPGKLISLLYAAIAVESREECVKLVPDLFRFLSEYRGYSLDVNNVDVYKYFSSKLDSECESVTEWPALPQEAIDFGADNPDLIQIVSDTLLPKKTALTGVSTASLGLYEQQMKKLRVLNETLWRNSIGFNCQRTNFAANDSKVLQSYFNYYLTALEKTAAENDLEALMKDAKLRDHRTRSPLDRLKKNSEPCSIELRFNENYKKVLASLENLRCDFSTVTNTNKTTERALSWTYLGYHQLYLFLNFGFIDPVLKTDLKLKYTEEDIGDLKNLVYANTLDSFIADDGGWLQRDSRLARVEEEIEKLTLQQTQLQKCKGYRSPQVPFEKLVATVGHITEKLDFKELTRNGEILMNAIEATEENPQAVESIRQAVYQFQRQLDQWEFIYTDLEEKMLPFYRELLLPALFGIAQMIHGAQMVIAANVRLVARRENLAQNFLHNFVRFPTIGPGQEDLVKLVDQYTSQSGRNLIVKFLPEENQAHSLSHLVKMVKNGLQELYNHLTLSGQFTATLRDKITELIHEIRLIWSKQQLMRTKAAMEAQSLYKNRAQVCGETASEEQEINEQLEYLFPSYRERDFHDVEKQPSLEVSNGKIAANDAVEPSVDSVSEEDFQEVIKIHSKIAKLMPVPWLKPSATVKRDYIKPLVERLNTFSLLLSNARKSLNSDLSEKLHVSLNVLASYAIRSSQGEELIAQETAEIVKSEPYDFYKSSNVRVVKECMPILKNLSDRVASFLLQWPEHPTLNTIKVIIERIGNFPIISPVSRFLTGLELLLTKLREWEENAHSGVSLAEYSAALTHQVISWRKLEFNCWKDCLNTSLARLRGKATKWWFFLHAVVDAYVENSELSEIPEALECDESLNGSPVDAKSLIALLDIFMTHSTLVEFQARLDLLLDFHVHVFHLDESERRTELLAILWNMHNYYSQFAKDVENRIKSMRAPIEKKLKDSVKIARWTDINYWSVKATVEKTHRTLLKFIREFETGLKQSVGALLVVRPTSYTSDADKGEWDRCKDRDYAINPRDFIIADSLLSQLDLTLAMHGELLGRIPALFKKAKDLCKNTILMSSYPVLRVELEHLVGEFMNQAIKLKYMDVDRSLPKEKQKSHAKSILQQKKMALADYFKTLTDIGVSYRKGVLTWQNRQSEVLNMTLPPLDLSVALQRVKDTGVADTQMLAQWRGCETYYYQSYVKMQALISTLTKAQSDLGVQNIERCRGNSIHLMLMAHEQKKTLADAFDKYFFLRQLISDLSNLDGDSESMPLPQTLVDLTEDLKKVLKSLLVGLEQCELYLHACPRQPEAEHVIILEPSNSPMINATQGDQSWLSAKVLITEAKNTVLTALENLNNQSLNVILMRTTLHLNFLKDQRDTVEKIANKLRNFGQMFGNDAEHPILNTLSFLHNQATRWTSNFDCMEKFQGNSATEYDAALNNVNSEAAALISAVLLVIQKKYKTAMTQNNESDEVSKDSAEELDDQEEVEEISQLSENGFRVKFVESLQHDVNDLNLEEISNKLSSLLNAVSLPELVNYHQYCNKILLKCLPMLKQYLLFSQFYLNEQVAALRVTCKLLYLQLNVFLDLATNGFCMPKDLDLDEAEGDAEGTEQSRDQGGIGLADGEGKKDISDQIESEDQLEDARPAGEEKQDDDRDCKEEEGGIDMSENFDGKLQDVEKEKGDEDSESGDDEEEDKDLEKEMGDTEKGADQLDEEIWGDENDSEPEDQNGDTDEQGRGEPLGEKELSAKDESKDKSEDTNETEERDGKSQEKKEINELNEPDVNDDQIDPYHGKQNAMPEPESMDLPEDLNLDDDDEGREDNADGEGNPFDIDEMKETMPPPAEAEETAESEEKKRDDDPVDDSSDEEGETPDENNLMKDLDAEDREEKESEPAESEPTDSNQPVAYEGEDKEDREEDSEEKNEEKAGPSVDDASKEMDASDQVENTAEGSKDKVPNAPNQDERQQTSAEESNQDDGDDKGTGQAQSEEHSEGHTGSAMQRNAPAQRQEKPVEKRKNPGESDENRALVDNVQPETKKQRMIHSREELKDTENDAEGPEKTEDGEVDMCQHVKDAEKFDDRAMDAATEEQVKKQRLTADEEEKEAPEDEAMDVDMHENAEDVSKDDVKLLDSEATPKGDKDKDRKKTENKNTGEENSNVETQVDVEGNVVETLSVQRPADSAFYTNLAEPEIDGAQVERKRQEVEEMLRQWTHVPSTGEALAAWNCLSAVAEAPARDLSEKLRLVLEPTQATRLKGDYRTGKRINMRKIIPYIASQFRKDKIWMRRTKPSKRDYQIVLAVDDSSSMVDNHSKELAFESLALISKAMGYLEVGELAVLSFGDSPKVLHPLGEPFSEQTGARLFQEMRFDQKKTMMAELVNFTVDMFANQRGSTDNAKLLVVLSDGRGIFSQGIDCVNQAVRRAKLADIFLVFIIVENPDNKDSILDIKMPVFENGKLLGIHSYMDSFPFPFYMILRDINALPGVLSDALRQWFEVVGKIEN